MAWLALIAHAEYKRAGRHLITMIENASVVVMLDEPVFDRGRRGDRRGIYNRSARELRSVGQQQFTDLGKQHCAKLMFFQQVTKVKQGRRIGHPLPFHVDPAGLPEHRHIKACVFASFVGEIRPVDHAVRLQTASPGPPAAAHLPPSGRAVQSARKIQPNASDFPFMPKSTPCELFALASRIPVPPPAPSTSSSYTFNSSPDFMTERSSTTCSVFP